MRWSRPDVVVISHAAESEPYTRCSGTANPPVSSSASSSRATARANCSGTARRASCVETRLHAARVAWHAGVDTARRADAQVPESV